MTTETKTESDITLSNFRVTYHAPRYEDGKVLYDGYCAILADDAALDGAEVKVFDVPDIDEGQLAAAQFAVEAMNQYADMKQRLEQIADIAHKAVNGGCKVPGKSERIGDVKDELRRIRNLAQ